MPPSFGRGWLCLSHDFRRVFLPAAGLIPLTKAGWRCSEDSFRSVKYYSRDWGLCCCKPKRDMKRLAVPDRVPWGRLDPLEHYELEDGRI